MLSGGHIGAMVKFHRKAAGLSRLQLADLAGVGKTLIFDIENGKASVRLNTLARVLRALNIRAQWSGPLMDAFNATRSMSEEDVGGDDA